MQWSGAESPCSTKPAKTKGCWINRKLELCLVDVLCLEMFVWVPERLKSAGLNMGLCFCLARLSFCFLYLFAGKQTRISRCPYPFGDRHISLPITRELRVSGLKLHTYHTATEMQGACETDGPPLNGTQKLTHKDLSCKRVTPFDSPHPIFGLKQRWNMCSLLCFRPVCGVSSLPFSSSWQGAEIN